MTIETNIEMIPIAKLQPSAGNPRKSFDDKAIAGLAQSIKTDGLLQNLVAARPEGRKRKFPIISGERRYRALQLLIGRGDLPKDVKIPVEVREGLSDENALRIATVENVQRVNLTPLEEADAIAALIHDGENLDDITVQTGLSESTIKRRLVLLDLCESVKEALASGQISASQAEALSLADHEMQDHLLETVIDGYYSSAGEIRNRIFGEAPSLAMAIFDKGDYQGTFTTDLFAEDETTYFDDAEQFFDLQKAAAEKLVSDFDKEKDWAELVEGRFPSVEYRKAEDGESGGVVVCLSYEGRVDVHEGLIRKKIDQSVSDALRSKPKVTYARPVLEYFAMYKSATVQAELIANPRKAKEIGVAKMLYHASCHDCLRYLSRSEEGCAALDAINAEAYEVMSTLGAPRQDATYSDVAYIASSQVSAYELVTVLDDQELERLFVFLCALSFGQAKQVHPATNQAIYQLDTNEGSAFNRVATDLGVDMRQYWKPDHWFLSRRTMSQLGTVLKDSGLSRLFGNGKGYKKSELVPAMLRYFNKVRDMLNPEPDHVKARDWLPEAMNFPAIDPDQPIEHEEDELSKAA